MSELGLTVLCDGGNSPLVDIVAVHGLGGDRLRTWTARNGRLWLRDFLHLDIPRARIMTFGYNADIFCSSNNTVPDHAVLLLEHLRARRRGPEPLLRPIVFIGHSLGGIVIKQALVTARDKEDCRSICNSTISVLFMGTPHRGSSAAKLGSIAVHCVKAIGIGATSSNLEQLQLDSTTLDDLCTEFASFVQRTKIKIISCFESEPMSLGVDVLVVPKRSARIGLGEPLEKAIPINGDHKRMAQFPSREDSQYFLVWTNLDMVIKSHLESACKDAALARQFVVDDLASWLGSASLSVSLKKYPVPGTCTWIREKEEYVKWRNSPTSSLLWIYGRPGAGKTVLSQYISQLLKLEKHAPLVYLKCNACRSNGVEILHILREIIVQLLLEPSLQRLLSEKLLDLRRANAAISSVSADRLLSVLDRTLEGTPSVDILIDGLDECDQESVEFEMFLQWICSLGSRKQSNFAVMILSRDVPTLRANLGDGATMEIQKSDTLPDIEKVVTGRIGQLEHLKSKAEQITKSITEGSNGCFLWADLALNDMSRMRTWKEISGLLEQRSCGLFATYNGIMTQLEQSSIGLTPLRRRVLTLVACAQRSLHLPELEEALAIREGTFTIDPDDRILEAPDTIKQACGSMVYLVGTDEVELIHLSAKEFILSEPIAQTPNTHSTRAQDAHRSMASICLTYLSLSSLEGIINHDQTSLRTAMQNNPLLDYATLYWFEHLSKASHLDTDSFRLLSNFISSPASGRWAITFFPWSYGRQGENPLSTFRAIQSMIAQIKPCLRNSQSVTADEVQELVDNLDRFLSTSIEESYALERYSHGESSRSAIEKLLNIAEYKCAVHDFAASEAKIKRALSISIAKLGEDDPLTLKIEHQKLLTEMQLQVLHPARSSHNFTEKLTALADRLSSTLGADNVATLCCQHDIGLTFFIRRDWGEVVRIMEPIHEKMIKHLGRTSHVTHRTVNNLASAYYYQHNTDEAERLLCSFPEVRKAASDSININIASLHSYTFDSLSLLAAIASMKGNHARSARLHRVVVDGLLGLQGPRCRKVYESARNIGFSLRHRRLFGEARRQYDTWLAKAREVFGEESAVCRKFEEEIVLLNTQERKWERCNGGNGSGGGLKGEEKGLLVCAEVSGREGGLRVGFERWRRLVGMVLLGVILVVGVFELGGRWGYRRELSTEMYGVSCAD